MGFSCGLVGLPNAGKSTLFNALTGAHARVESYPFCTIEANAGTVSVPDERLERLARLYPDKRKVPSQIRLIDIAGLVENASHGEGMGNQFLSEIRATDAILQVVRCFEQGDVAHVAGHVDPVRDMEVVETELLLKDLETLQRAQKRLQQETKGKDRTAPARLAAWESLLEAVSAGVPLRSTQIPAIALPMLRELSPLTLKPMLVVANVGDDGDGERVETVARFAADRHMPTIAVRARLEEEIGETADSPSERAAYLRQYGVATTALDRLVQAGHQLLDLVTFYTIEGAEVRAWTVPQGTCAPDAGARIHTDFAQRFVVAEIVSLDELSEAGSERALRDAGKIRRAGHDYVVADGDIVRFICA